MLKSRLTRVKQSDVFDRRLTIKTMVLKRQSNRPQKKKTLQQKQEYSNTHDYAVSNCGFLQYAYNVLMSCHVYVHLLYMTMSWTQCTYNVHSMFAQCTLQMYTVMYIWWPINCAFYALADVTSNLVNTVHLGHIYSPF